MWGGSIRDRCRVDEGRIGEGSMWGGYRLKNEQKREEGK